MRSAMRGVMLVAAMAGAQMLLAQAPAGSRPSGSTGQCKDGTYTTAASKAGACRGHKGVKEWYAADGAAASGAAGGTSATGGSAATAGRTGSSPEAHGGSVSSGASGASVGAGSGGRGSSSATTTKTAKPSAGSTGAAAAGGGPGMVWVNAESNVYHCPGTRFYGKTAKGSYMTEAEAKAKGAHADHGHPCSK